MIITIVGSMAFYDDMVKVRSELLSRGHEVILPRKDPMPEPVPKDFKLKAMQVFNRNLSKSDAILVLNRSKPQKPNHIGVNTLMEIGMAFNQGKRIYLSDPIPDFCMHELEAIGVRHISEL